MTQNLRVVLISTYELGHQPFGLASPAAWLREAGAQVTCLDLAVERLDEAAIAAADLVAFYVPMHTATRLAASFVERVKRINPNAHLCFYGLYAPVNEEYLRGLGAGTILGGEFEEGLVALVERLSANETQPSPSPAQPEPTISLTQAAVPRPGSWPATRSRAVRARQAARWRLARRRLHRGQPRLQASLPPLPDRPGLRRPVLRRATGRRAGGHRASGGGRSRAHHLRRPRFLQRSHPRHAHRRRSCTGGSRELTYDVIIKVEHLLQHARHLPTLRDTGCLFVTSAVEAVDDRILEIFDKRHTREDFVRAVSLCREVGLNLNPTFVTFNPWITLAGYRDLLSTILELDLVGNVSPIQYAIRLLIPRGSRLLELPLVQEFVGDFDPAALAYPWTHPDPRMDRLHADVLAVVGGNQTAVEDRFAIFARVWELTEAAS